MSKVHVAPELLAKVLFPGAEVEVTGAGFDTLNGCIVFDVRGADVPAADWVSATISVTLGEDEPRRILKTVFGVSS